MASISDMLAELAERRRAGDSIGELAAVAKRELGRSVSREEVRAWLAERGVR